MSPGPQNANRRGKAGKKERRSGTPTGPPEATAQQHAKFLADPHKRPRTEKTAKSLITTINTIVFLLLIGTDSPLPQVATTDNTMNNSSSSASTSNHVYIESDEFAWLPARLLETDSKGETATVSVVSYGSEDDILSRRRSKTSKNVTKTIQLKGYPANALPLQNVDEHGELVTKADLVDLPFLNEPAILYNLKVRHLDSKPYTRTGEMIIACNPYQWFDELYSESVRCQYADAIVWDRSNSNEHLEPHVYETSSTAYRGLAVEGDDQSILVSGESGAGKTETVKILLNDIASVQRGVHHDSTAYHSPIVQRVLDSNPLLEAFGNAKTVRNDNSSRFGKYIQLQFDAEDPVQAAYRGKLLPSCVLAGSTCEVYLLEKSRVVTHEPEERTYHIFYQLLAIDNEQKTQFWEGLRDCDQESFSYVGCSDTTVIEGKSDAERFQQTVQSLALVGVQGEALLTLMRSICIVLQLGNIVFEEDPNDETRSVIADDNNTMTGLSELMGIAEADLVPALTVRTVKARNEEFKVPLTAETAKESCDAFAKEIYNSAFLWLVRAINAATAAEHNYERSATAGKNNNNTKFGTIGLLDIFGFEVFETNRFEQLCINFANEKLQQKFTQDVFRAVQAEYEYEGIELGEITYDDNTDVLDLIEGRMGLLAFLNEECVRPGGSDKGFVAKAAAMNKETACFIREKGYDDYDFGIHHYAARVIYNAEGFVTKNMDTLPADLLECAKKSTNAILRDELGNDAMMKNGETATTTTAPRKSPTHAKSSKKATTSRPPPKRSGSSSLVGVSVFSKFKNQLTTLMTNLKQTRTRYIRCIKPNAMKKPLVMQHLSTVEQLRCAGVVAAVTISRSAFPNRLEHGVVLDRFRAVWGKGEHLAAEDEVEHSKAVNDNTENDADEKTKRLVDRMLSLALKSLESTRKDGITVKAFVLGKTRTYFRAGALEYLENERVRCLSRWAVEIQRIGRQHIVRARFRRYKQCTILLESAVRMLLARRHFLDLRAAAIRVQCFDRCVQARLLLISLRRQFNATLLQTHWRMAMAVSRLKANRRAAVTVQRIVRGSLQRPKYRVALIEKREEAKLENQVVALQRKLEEAEKRRVEAEKRAEERARTGGMDDSQQQQTQQDTEEKKEEEKSVPSAVSSVSRSAVAPPTPGQLSAQQQTLMDESGKMLEYLRKEVFKLRSHNAKMREDFDLLKDNNQRLMDANASAGASFAALNQHAKQLSRTNDKLQSDCQSYKQQVQKLSVTQVELKEELKMKQATYVAEVHSRLQYQRALSKIIDVAQEKCRDDRLVEEFLRIADAAEAQYMDGPTGLQQQSALRSPLSPFGGTPRRRAGNNDSAGFMSNIRNLWS